MSPEKIEGATPGTHVTSVFFGYISGLSDREFLRYPARAPPGAPAPLINWFSKIENVGP
jgi:hypothetical protein